MNKSAVLAANLLDLFGHLYDAEQIKRLNKIKNKKE